MGDTNVTQTLLTTCCKTQKRIWDAYYQSMFKISLRITNNIEDTEDVINESFIKLFKHACNIKSDVIGGYLKKIVINTSINKIRINKSKYEVDINDVFEHGYIDHSFTQYDYKVLIDIIDTLPKGYKSVFKLYVLEGLQHNEIAKILNIDEGTSRSQLSKAKKQLQKKVKFVF